MLPACRGRSQPAKERDFRSIDLLIRASEIPEGWYERSGAPVRCIWIAHYEEFIVEFITWLIPDYMSDNDIKQVIKAIDARMARYLELEK